MSEQNQVIPLNSSDERQFEVLGSGLPITRNDLATVKERISILKNFVQSQMVEGVDYGVIQGTGKQSLWQPGAQKLARLFGLTAKKKRTYQKIDRESNFAMFTYKVSVYHARTGETIAECEGSCNSQEKKYSHRKTKGGALEATPIFDVLNTLQKMAQKRAFVGAVIEACGAADFYTQDIEDDEDARTLGVNNREVTTVKTSIPNTTSSKSSDQTQKDIGEAKRSGVAESKTQHAGSANCPDCGAEGRISKYNESEMYCSEYKKGCKAKWPAA